MEIILPKKYLSYSQIDLWIKNKNEYRLRYYEGKKSPDTVYTLFGRDVHEQIDTDPKFADIRLPKAEHKILVEVSGIPVMGYLDTYHPVTHYFGDYKTGIRKPDGKPRWTQYDVEMHEQLPFYSLLIQEKYGVKMNKSYLVWLETIFKDTTIKKGATTINLGRELLLTGEMERFERRIYQYDRDRMKKWIIKSAKEIHNDYGEWRRSQEIFK